MPTQKITIGFTQKNTALYKWASVLALITIFYNIGEGLISVFRPGGRELRTFRIRAGFLCRGLFRHRYLAHAAAVQEERGGNCRNDGGTRGQVDR
jgi:hypothetical protein